RAFSAPTGIRHQRPGRRVPQTASPRSAPDPEVGSVSPRLRPGSKKEGPGLDRPAAPPTEEFDPVAHPGVAGRQAPRSPEPYAVPLRSGPGAPRRRELRHAAAGPPPATRSVAVMVSG